MIEIKERPGMIRIAGHAGKAGNLTCEDITALFINLIISLEELTEDEFSYTVKKGLSLLTYKGALSERAQLLVESFFVGACAISNRFPDLVRVSRPA